MVEASGRTGEGERGLGRAKKVEEDREKSGGEGSDQGRRVACRGRPIAGGDLSGERG